MPDPCFVDLQTEGSAHRLSVPIAPYHCVGRIGEQFLFGGMGMAFAVRAFETCFASSLKWATIQYLAPTPLGALLEIQVNQGYGNRTAQAALRGIIGGQEVMFATAALGTRSDGATANGNQCLPQRTQRSAPRFTPMPMQPATCIHCLK